MRLWFHRYTLTPRRALSGIARPGERHGALLRVLTGRVAGFADVHPWPELGDASLEEQLALLARGETTALTRASLQHAARDADARERGVSLFEHLTIPESHWPGNEPPPGFDTVKVKGVQPVPEHVRIRIDFNATLTPDEFLRIAATLPNERIDFIEDPCPYDAETWRDLRNRTQLRLALDRFTGTADVLVHKPALSAEFPSFDGEIVVTSYMDHAVGQFGAAYVAATNRVSARCGLMTHVLYEPDPFFERIERRGARLLPPRGTGIGFDDLLEDLPWTTLR
ncbi:MAG TPA: enolase C-terminal domain-like protein [Thermoanaerobaculia bacterium]|jgi:O-succinylbenzoate synthase